MHAVPGSVPRSTTRSTKFIQSSHIRLRRQGRAANAIERILIRMRMKNEYFDSMSIKYIEMEWNGQKQNDGYWRRIDLFSSFDFDLAIYLLSAFSKFTHSFYLSFSNA